MKVYKYMSCNYPQRINEILSGSVFYFADWRELNDPMEGYFHYYDADHSPDELRKIVQGKDAYGICCFSMNSDEILMWAHYASNHKGICIEIDADMERSPEVTLEPIKYQPKIPWVKQRNGKIRDAKDILSRKIKKWKYEQEIRAFCEGKYRKLRVGRITKVILGLRVDGEVRRIVHQHIENPLIAEARLDFETNKIEC